MWEQYNSYRQVDRIATRRHRLPGYRSRPLHPVGLVAVAITMERYCEATIAMRSYEATAVSELAGEVSAHCPAGLVQARQESSLFSYQKGSTSRTIYASCLPAIQ